MDSAVHGEKRLCGNVARLQEHIQDPSVSNFFEVLVGHGTDLLGALSFASGFTELAINSETGGSIPELGGAAEPASEGATAGGSGSSPEVGSIGDKLEDLPYVGDEIKFFRDLAQPSGDGDAAPVSFVDKLCDAIPDDLKVNTRAETMNFEVVRNFRVCPTLREPPCPVCVNFFHRPFDVRRTEEG